MNSDTQSSLPRFPAGLLAFALMLTAASTLWLAWNVYDSNRLMMDLEHRHIRSVQLQGVIIHLDEVLTMSARMAAATGDVNWEKRYRRYEPELDAAIKEATQLAPQPALVQMAAQTDAANLKLVDMENRAFTLVQKGQLEQARAVLFSPAYEEQKLIYAAGITHLVEELNKQFDARMHSRAIEAWSSILSASVVMVVLLVTWFSALRTLTQWRAAFQRVHEGLEVRVRERTAALQKANLEVHAYASRQEAILAAIPDILMEVDNRKVYTWANQAGLAFFGDDVIGKEAACFFEGEQPTYQSVQPLFNGQQDVISLESWQRRKDGERRLLAWRCRVLKDAGGNVTGALSSARDITERVLAEEELRFKNAQLSTQLEASIDGILVMDENAHILSYNRRFVEMWGLPAKLVEDKIDEPVLQFVTAQVLDSRPFPQRIQYLYEYSLEISRDELVLVDGRFFDLYSAPMLGPDEHYYGRVWYFRDITERMRADESEERALLRQQGISQLQQLLLTPIALEDRLRNVTDVIVRLFDVDFCRIWLIRPGDLCERDCLHAEVREGPHVCRDRDRCLHLVSSSGRYTHIDGRGHRRVPFGCYKIGRVAAGEDHKFVTNDVQNDPLVHDRVWAHDLGLVSFAGYQLRAPGGEPLGVLALFAKHPILVDEDAILDGLGSTVALVVQRAVAETALRRSETKFRTLYDSSGDAVMLLNAKGFFDCNQAALAIFGCATREEFCSKHPADMSPPTQPDGTVSLILANQHIAVALEKGSNHFEWIHQRADTGETFPADVMLTAMELDGRPVLQALVRNVTERKRLEDQLRQLSRAMEQSPASIVITDDAGTIEYVNPKFVEITGYTLAEARGENPRILKSGDSGPEVYRELWRTITSGKVWRGEFHNKKKSGELYWESASISAIRDLAGRITHFVAVKEDITARKLTETERTLLIQRLQDALANVKALSGLLPICAGCKKIRDDQGYWNQVESYVQQHSEATFTHGMCPECIKKFFPGISKPTSTPDEDTRR